MGKKYIKIFNMTLVNLITATRLVGSFALPFLYAKYGSSFSAVFVIIMFLTDAIDGFLARHLHVSTFFGSMMDAFSDKLFNAIAFIILGIEYNIMIAPIIIEIAILYTGYSTYRYGGVVLSSNVGKMKTVVLDIFVILSYVLLSLPTFNIKALFIKKLINQTEFIMYIFAFIILIAGLVALVDYLGRNKVARANPKSDDIKNTKRKKKTFKQLLSNIFDTEYYQKHKDESAMKQFYIE